MVITINARWRWLQRNAFLYPGSAQLCSLHIHRLSANQTSDAMKSYLQTFLAALALGCWAIVSAQEPATTSEQSISSPECGPRIRKSWDLMTVMEKDVYIRALQRTMDDGLYIKFVEIHTEQMTTAEAHRTCMFVYWHRVLLLGFENLLRSYGGEFACITVPYWDYVSHNARFLAGQCSSMEDCSPILQELGGSMRGRARSVTVNGTPITGTCVAMPPVDHFCESSHVSGAACAQCVPRGDWASASFPATTSVSSLMRQLFTTLSIDAVATNLEQGIHNTVHNSLGGAMGVLEAPADPIFFSHHASIDLLHSIFYHCAVGNTEPMPLEAKIADPRQFVQCARRTALPSMRRTDRNVIVPQSEVTLRSGESGGLPESVRLSSSPLQQAFAPLPIDYMSYSDIRDIGEFSYNYEMSGLLANMFTTCADVSTLINGGGGGGRQRQRQLQPSSMLEAVIVDSASGNSTGGEWYGMALRAALNVTTAIAAKNPAISATALALREVEKMTCLFYDECRGSVADLSTTFRSSFHVNANTTTPCHAVVSAVSSGRDRMLVAGWKQLMLDFFTC